MNGWSDPEHREPWRASPDGETATAAFPKRRFRFGPGSALLALALTCDLICLGGIFYAKLEAKRETDLGQVAAIADDALLRGRLEPTTEPRPFGVLASDAASPDLSAGTVTPDLARQPPAAKSWPLSLQGMSATKTIDSLGAIVTGVNDEPEPFTFGEDPPSASGAVASVPMSPAALAEQRAREAKYGYGAKVAGSKITTRAATAPNGKAAVYDASEGTSIDPLNNKTYDLSYAKDVPDLKTPGK